MRCSIVACYRKRPVEDKNYAVDFNGGQNFGEGQLVRMRLFGTSLMFQSPGKGPLFSLDGMLVFGRCQCH